MTNLTQPIVDTLNRALEADSEAIFSLFNNRVKCNSKLADDDYIQVLQQDEDCYIGLLGLLNGFAASEGERIVLICNNGEPTRFEAMDFAKYKSIYGG